MILPKQDCPLSRFSFIQSMKDHGISLHGSILVYHKSPGTRPIRDQFLSLRAYEKRLWWCETLETVSWTVGMSRVLCYTRVVMVSGRKIMADGVISFLTIPWWLTCRHTTSLAICGTSHLSQRNLRSSGSWLGSLLPVFACWRPSKSRECNLWSV